MCRNFKMYCTQQQEGTVKYVIYDMQGKTRRENLKYRVYHIRHRGLKRQNTHLLWLLGYLYSCRNDSSPADLGKCNMEHTGC
jgi:hypothetical protein